MSSLGTRLFFTRTLRIFLQISILFAMIGYGGGVSADTLRKEVPPDIVFPLEADGEVCSPGFADTNCHFGSGVAVDITGDGNLETIVTTNKGFVYAITHTGTVLWKTDIAPAYGMAAGTQEIQSGAAVADIDNDGSVEIVVANGPIRVYGVCTPGGVIVLNKNGGVESGWPKLGVDEGIAPSNCPDAFFGTPALGDIDKDGQMEIVAGGFDKRIYAWNPDGSLQAGFPNASAHASWLPGADLHLKLADTIWSSPALADLTGDGFLEIVIGTDEGNFRDNPTMSWVCPYISPHGSNGPFGPYCGGSLYTLDYRGNILPGWPRYFTEVIYSSPAIGDLDNDGKPEIVVGTGEFFFLNANPGASTGPTDEFKVYAIDTQGNDIAGWVGGKTTLGPTPASPALGDLDGDGDLEVVMLDSSQNVPSGPYSRFPEKESRLYVWHHNGQVAAGFPRKAVDHFGTSVQHQQGKSPILADYDGDGLDEIMVNVHGDLVIIDSDGSVFTAAFPGEGNPKPFYASVGTLLNAPVAADLDGDGQLNLTTTNSRYQQWEIAGSSSQAGWPMFKANAARTGSVFVPKPVLQTAPNDITVPVDVNDNISTATSSIVLEVDYAYAGTINVSGSSGRVSVVGTSISGGTVRAQVEVDVSGLGLGTYDYTLPLEVQINSDTTIYSVKVTVVVADFEKVFLPILTH